MHRFLVVDDEPDVLDSIRRLFRRDYELHLAGSAEEALDLLGKHDMQLVMSDQRMPDVTGVELLTEVRRRHPRAVRMLFTGYGDIQAVIQAINDGHVYRYIHKPFDPAELKVIVAQAAEFHDMRLERERLHEQLAERNARLERQNRELDAAYRELQTLDRLKTVFMEVVSHELNTPTAIIIGYAALLKRDLVRNNPETYTKALDGIQGSGQRLKGIAEKVLKMMAANNPRVELDLASVDAGALLQQLRTELAPVLTVRRQTLQLDAQPGLALQAEPAYLRDMLMNLVVNAIKFSPDEKTVWLGAEPTELDGRPAVRFIVRDEGIGIRPEDRDRIFDAFFGTFDTLHHSSGDFGFSQRGLGLGLAIVKAFVDMHRGRIEFDSVLGQGTTFHVTLPAHPA